MASTTQIVPQYSFPYVETHITDYTELDSDNYNDTAVDPTIPYLFAFGSTKGIDNRWVLKRTQSDFVRTFGTPSFKKYGQANLTPYSVLESPNNRVWCYRCMPENATRSHAIIDLWYRADTADDIETAADRKFRIKYTKRVVPVDDTTNGPIIDASDIDAVRYAHATTLNNGEYLDSEGYTEVPGVMVYTANGRGAGSDSYSVRIANDLAAEKEYGYKLFDFEILNSENGLTKEEEYVGSIVTCVKFNEQTFINDVLLDTDDGVAALNVDVDEELFSDVYDAYMEFLTGLKDDIQTDRDQLVADNPDITDEMIAGSEAIPDEYLTAVVTIRNYDTQIYDLGEDNLPTLEQFDPILGLACGVSGTEAPHMYFPTQLTDDVDTADAEYVALDYTETDIVSLTSVRGVTLEGGDDGYFANPRTTTVIDKYGEESQKLWTFQEELDQALIDAYSGTYDKRILTPKRIDCYAFFDCNYSYDVKCAIADLVLARDDAIFYMDTGIHSTLSTSELKSLTDQYSQFANRLVSKNLHHYVTKDPITKKRITVTITYWMASNYTAHLIDYGIHIPWVKGKARLSGHIKNSLLPTIEEYEVDMKELLIDNRFNYFETVEDNVYERATQNTAQTANSDLLEESNVNIMYYAKRIVEEDIRARLYDFNEASVRNEFTITEQAKFSTWPGRLVQSIDIQFSATAWEMQRSIIHCYIDIVFRGLFKRGIVEVDINRRTYDEEA